MPCLILLSLTSYLQHDLVTPDSVRLSDGLELLNVSFVGAPSFNLELLVAHCAEILVCDVFPREVEYCERLGRVADVWLTTAQKFDVERGVTRKLQLFFVGRLIILRFRSLLW